MNFARWCGSGVFALGAVVAGCGHAGTAVTPKDITTLDALGRDKPTTCTDKAPKLAKPIVVDLDEAARTDLDAAMRKHVVVVAYDCASIRVLRNCEVDAKYDYGGVDPKENVIQMKNQDELSVNLPLSTGKLGGEVKSGRSIDIAMIYRGQKTTAFDNISRETLLANQKDPSNCDGATHFIRQATLGAFAVVQGSAGKVSAAAEMFKVGASASSDASKSTLLHDGSIEACSGAAQDGELPIEHCRAPLVLELQPILGAAPKKEEAKKDEIKPPEAEENPCRDGYVYAKGICTKSTDEAHSCDPKNQGECQVQCTKGSADSCFNLGVIAYGKDDQAAYEAFKKACDGQVAEGCAYQSSLMSRKGVVTGIPESKRDAEEERVASAGCGGGSAESCLTLGRHFAVGSSKDMKKAARAYRRGCTLGEARGCASAADAYREGDPEAGIDPDFAMALDYAKKGCADPTDINCTSLAEIYFDKRAGAIRNEAKGFAVLDGVCVDTDSCMLSLLLMSLDSGFEAAIAKQDEKLCAKEPKHCDMAAMAYESGGEGFPKNPTKARALYKKACDADHDERACEKSKAPAAPKKPAKKRK